MDHLREMSASVNFIPDDKYAEITEVLPILCVDVLLRNPKGEYLLVKRANEQLKGQWWVIGGRVFKGETLKQAAIRKIKEETGFVIDSIKPIGYFEDLSHANRYASSTLSHSISVVFSAVVDSIEEVKLDNQSSDWKYSPEMPKDFIIKSWEL